MRTYPRRNLSYLAAEYLANHEGSLWESDERELGRIVDYLSAPDEGRSEVEIATDIAIQSCKRLLAVGANGPDAPARKALAALGCRD